MSDIVDRDKSILIPRTFNGVEILEIEYEGKAVFIAQQAGAAFGYAEPDKLANNIVQKWSEDFREIRDFIKLTNGALAEFKAAVNHRPDRAVVDPRASHLILLTESGAQLAAILSRTPQGRAFRHWLVDVVLPERQARTAPPPAQPPRTRQRRPRGGLRALSKSLSLDDLEPSPLNEWQAKAVAEFDKNGGDHPFMGVREHLIWRAVRLLKECSEDTWCLEVLTGLASEFGMVLATFEGDPLLERAQAEDWLRRAQAKELFNRMTDLQLVRALAVLGHQMGIFTVVSGLPIRLAGWRWNRGPDSAEELQKVRLELDRANSKLSRIERNNKP